ncbi:MAG: hypothetical protein J1F69_03685 [Clostridiales bacterium]|nr:hypothetical protein [Clostridiales bacterium]
MEQIKFRNARGAVCFGAYFITAGTVFCCVFGIIMTYFFENAREFTVVYIVGASVIAGTWAIAGLIILLQTTVIVTENEIKLCRGKKIKWSISKDEILECIYNQIHWYDILVPISAINAFQLCFKLKNGVVSRKKVCSLSFKQVNIIRDKFNYPVRNIDTVYEE